MFIFLKSPSFLHKVVHLHQCLSFLINLESYPAHSFMFIFPHELQYQLILLHLKKACWYFYWNCIKSINWFKESWHLYNVESSYPGTENVFPFVQVYSSVFQKNFKVLLIYVFLCFLLIPRYLIFFITIINRVLGFPSHNVLYNWVLVQTFLSLLSKYYFA